MSVEFNKQLMLDNISFMLKEFGKKIGELEAEAGVSPGYISRTSKDDKAKPGIDFIVKVAEALNTSVDTLLNIDLAGLTPTERYLISFIEKLKRDTANDKLEWLRHSADSLNRMETDYNGCVEHPLFSYEKFLEQGEGDYPDEVERVVFTSHSYDVHTYISGDCFSLRLKNGAILYLMDISKSVFHANDSDAYAREIWMFKPRVGVQFMCSNRDNSSLAALVDDLYAVVKEFSKHPKIKRGLQDAIDAFMRDDLEDDEDDGALPF